MRTGVIEQPLADVFPNGMRPVKPDGIQRLDFDDAIAANALHSQHMPRDFRRGFLCLP
jgi:hypothetical protein